MQVIPLVVMDEVQEQLSRAHSLKKQSSTVSLSEDIEITSYWVGNVYRVDIKLPKEKEVIV